MGLTISIPEVEVKINEINKSLNITNSNLNMLRNGVNSYLSSSSLQGKAYSNARAYFNNVYIPLINGLIAVNENIINKNSSLVNTFNNYVPNPEGFETDTDVLEKYIQQLEYQNAQYQDELDNLSFWDSVGEFIKEHWYWAESLREKIAANNKRIKKIREVINGMNDFNTSCKNMYDSAFNMLNLIEQNTSVITPKNWNCFSKEFIVTLLPNDNIKEVLFKAEYEKMHNDDGTINKEYIHQLMNQDAIEGDPSEIEAKYLALIATFEEIKDEQQLQDFLNACYRIKILEKSDPPKNPNMMDSYNYFYSNARAQTKNYDVISLSPVFKEMTYYYQKYVLPDDLNKLHFDTGLSEKELNEIKNRLTHGGILLNVLTYGNKSYEVIHSKYTTANMVKVNSWQQDEFLNKNVISMTIGTSLDNNNIVQYQYTDENANIWNLIDNVDAYIKSQYVSMEDFALEQCHDFIKDNAIESLTEACGTVLVGSNPYVAGGFVAIELLVGIAEVIDENNAAANAADSISLAKMTAALGIEGQVCTVDGKAGFQYLTVDKNTLATNLGAYNMAAKDYNKPTFTVSDLINDKQKLKQFAEFYCGNTEQGKYIDKYKQSLNGKDPTDIFSEEEKQLLIDSISDRK